MKRRRRLLFLLVPAVTVVPLAIIGMVAWGSRPLPLRSRTYTSGGYSYRVVSTRRHELLPLAQWGFSARDEGSIGCGRGSGGQGYSETVSLKRVGIVAVIDTEAMTYQPIK